MKRYSVVLLFCLFALLPLQAVDFYGYTEEKPLTIVCDWDFRPFEFLDANGQPAGYNVDVLSDIFNRLGIPHRFVLKEWHDAAVTFEQRDADLIHAMAYNYYKRPYVVTKKYVNYYTLKAARKVTTPQLSSLFDLDKTTMVCMKRNDYADLQLREMDSIPFTLLYQSPKDGLTKVRGGRYDYYVWGEEPLKRKVRELALDSLVLDPVDIPPGEMRIIGYDNELIDVIDDTYARMEQEGDLQRIYDKWFHPERHHDDESPVGLLIIIGLAIATIVVFLLSRLIRLRVRAAVRRNTDLNSMMTRALNMGDFYVLKYDIKAGWVYNAYNALLPQEGVPDSELVSRIHPDEMEDFREAVESMKRGEVDEWHRRKRWNYGTPEQPDWREYDGSAILERENGKPRYIFHTFKDITREVAETAHNQKMAALYKGVFDTNLIAMAFYDAQGRLLDFNQKMRVLCSITEANEQAFRQINLFEDTFTKDLAVKGSDEVFHVCAHLQYPDLGVDKFVEVRVQPVVDDGGQVVYYIVTSRDVTAERDMYMQQRRHDVQLQQSNEQINHYERQLRYLLEESKMFVWKYDLRWQRIDFSRTLRQVEYSETLKEYLDGMDENDRAVAYQNMHETVEKGLPFNAIHHFHRTPLAEASAWYSISGIPMHNADGQVSHYFGLVRDITDLMSAQEQLKKETSRAEDSGRMKAAFLANMTHEIRTPLNAIVGFSDLLQVIDNPEERLEFIRIIRNNCDMLLRLINDILEASSMGQALAIKPEPIDLASVFNDICQTLEQRVQEPGVAFEKDNPYDNFPAVIDKGRLQQMLTNFVTNAVKYTHEGHIRVGYREMTKDGKAGLYFYCEDTGAGIPKEKQAAVFERFVKLNDYVQGTGLGLSICKALVERVNGQIGVTSEGEGHGSTFWFWIPKGI